MKRIALVGDPRDEVAAHRAIPIALRMAVERLRAGVAWEWLHTRTIQGDVARLLEPFAAVWCVPGSPYQNTAGALAAIRFARKSRRPFLGTCGGFQHALLEYAEDVWGVSAGHAETDPDAPNPVIAPLACSLVDVAGELHFTPGSRLAEIYGSPTATEEYRCNYGLSVEYAARLGAGPLRVAARDAEGSVRAVELEGEPFFVATLFQPERAALHARLAPLVSAFVTEASKS